MSSGSTTRHAQRAGGLGFAVEFNAETSWHFVVVVVVVVLLLLFLSVLLFWLMLLDFV